MRHTLTLMAALVVAFGLQAQSNTSTADTLGQAEQPHVSLQIGLGGGATLYSNIYDDSPYYSRYGLFVQVPLMFGYEVSPRWELRAGLRYDFCFDPLYYPVKVNYAERDGLAYSQGLDFESAPVNGKQSAYALRSYIGIPLQATWYPYPREKRLLQFQFDLFAGYAVGRTVMINHRSVSRTIAGDQVNWSDTSPLGEELTTDDNTLLRWRLELGATVSTDVLGLIHGVRFFGNLLPTYRDPLTGDGVYLFGMNFYL